MTPEEYAKISAQIMDGFNKASEDYMKTMNEASASLMAALNPQPEPEPEPEFSIPQFNADQWKQFNELIKSLLIELNKLMKMLGN